MFIPAFTTSAMTLDFLSSIFPGLALMFLDSYRMVLTFLSWLDLLGVAPAFRINSKNLQLTYKILTQGYRYHKGLKHSESSSGHTPTCCLNFGKISFQEYVTEGISHPVFYKSSSLQTKGGQM